jgi:hypothetical protein
MLEFGLPGWSICSMNRRSCYAAPARHVLTVYTCVYDTAHHRCAHWSRGASEAARARLILYRYDNIHEHVVLGLRLASNICGKMYDALNMYKISKQNFET